MLRYRIVTTGFIGAPGYNIIHTAGDTLDEAEARALPLIDFIDDFAAVQAQGVTITLDPVVNLVDVLTGDTTGSVLLPGFTRQGAFGVVEAPAGICLLARWRTGVYVGGREIRGRSFFSGLGDIAGSEGTPDAAPYLTASQAVDTLVSAGDLVVYSPTRGVAAPVTDGQIWNRFALMRSRRD